MAVQAIVANAVKKKIIDWIQKNYPGGIIGFVASIVIVFIVFQYFIFTFVIYSVLSAGASKSSTICQSPDISYLDNYSDDEIAAMSDEEYSNLVEFGFNTYYPGQVSYNVVPAALVPADTALATSSALIGTGLVYPLPQNTGTIYSATNKALRAGLTTEGKVVAPAAATVYKAEQTDEYGGTIIFKLNDASAGDYSNVYVEYSRLDPISIQVHDGDSVLSGDYVGNVADVGDAESGKHIRVMVYGNNSDDEVLNSLGNTTAWYAASSASWYVDTTGTPASGAGFNGGGEVCSLTSGLGGVGAVGSGEMAVGEWGGFSNGRIPSYALIEVRPGRQFAPRVAQAFFAMDNNYFAETGSHLIINSAYRDYAGQLATYAKYGDERAAWPGTSNHGWGEAVDLGVSGGYNGATYAWLTENGLSYGFVNPPWALQGRGREEPWHWEYIYSPA